MASTRSAKLIPLEIRRWHEQIAKTPARYAKIPTPGDRRKRKHTANHALATLRAWLFVVRGP